MSLKNSIKQPAKLSTRLTIWYTVSFLILFSMIFLGLYLFMSSTFNENMKEDLTGDIEELQEIYEEQGMSTLLREVNQEILTEDPEQFFIRLTKQDGTVLLQSELSNWQYLTTPDVLYDLLSNSEGDVHIARLTKENSEVFTAAGLIGPDLLIYLGETMEERDDLLNDLLGICVVILGFVLPLGAFSGWWMSRKAVSGIKEVSRAVDDLGNGRLDRRVIVHSHGDEITELANKFNEMAEQIRKLISEMREMTDNIAHDLRSPLGRIRAISESVLSSKHTIKDYEKAASDTLEECDRLLLMINMTLDVAEAEASVREPNSQEVNLSSLTEDACELYGPVAETKQIQLSTHLAPNCSIYGNKHNLQRMLANLIDNAVKYTPEHGEIIVELALHESDAIVTVADTGIGVPDSDKDRIFDRFYRCDHSRTKDGCGLGLSFSRAVARAHGGDIKLRQKQSLSSVFEISLPMNR